MPLTDQKKCKNQKEQSMRNNLKDFSNKKREQIQN